MTFCAGYDSFGGELSIPSHAKGAHPCERESYCNCSHRRRDLYRPRTSRRAHNLADPLSDAFDLVAPCAIRRLKSIRKLPLGEPAEGKSVMEKLTFLELAKKVLREENRPLAPSEIWKIAVSKGYEKSLESTGKTPARTLYAAILLNERDSPDTEFVKYDTSPARYFLKDLISDEQSAKLQAEAASEPSVPEIHRYTERDLHVFLSYFIYQRFNANAKTIHHKLRDIPQSWRLRCSA
jgi:hypothetical protein